MNYNPNIHHRRSIRLKGYDYSQAGLYFITICVQNRECLFGEIRQDEPIRRGEPTCSPEMFLNDAGRMIEKWYDELENKYPDIRCHEMIVMPNHFHCIIQKLEFATNAHVPTMDAHVPTTDAHVPTTDAHVPTMDAHVGAPLRGHPETNRRPETNEKYGMYNKKYGATIGDMMDWFKTMTTNEYIRGVKTLGWIPFDGKLWQRNYWEHIIRNEKEYNRIAEYINNNPLNWDKDTLK